MALAHRCCARRGATSAARDRALAGTLLSLRCRLPLGRRSARASPSVANWHWLFIVYDLPVGATVLAFRERATDVGGQDAAGPIQRGVNAGTFASLVIGAELLPTRPALAAVLLAAAALELWRRVRWNGQGSHPTRLTCSAPFIRFSVIASACRSAGTDREHGLRYPFYLQHQPRQNTLMAGCIPRPAARCDGRPVRRPSRGPRSIACASALRRFASSRPAGLPPVAAEG